MSISRSGRIARHVPPKRVSDKRAAKLAEAKASGVYPPRSVKPLRSVKPRARNAKRQAKEEPRKQGTKARRLFVASLPCSACGLEGFSQGAHVLGNGGMSRKGNAEEIAPLCGPHWETVGRASFIAKGCHKLYDTMRWIFAERFPTYNAERAAAETEQAWQEHSNREAA